MNDSGFGIIVVTTENMDKPWLNFEAGALSKSLGGDSPRVVPLLVNFDEVYQLRGPISQFQAVRKLDKDGISRLCRSIASVIGLDPVLINSRFEWAWPDLEMAIEQAKQGAGNQPAPPDVDEKDLLANLAKMVRQLDRKVTDLSVAVGPFAEVGVGNSRRFIKLAGTGATDPWTDGSRMQQIQDEIKEWADSNYRPVRYVSPMNWKGDKVVGVVFEDGQGMASGVGDFNKFMNEARQRWPVTIAIVSDRDLQDMRAD